MGKYLAAKNVKTRLIFNRYNVTRVGLIGFTKTFGTSIQKDEFHLRSQFLWPSTGAIALVS